MKNIFLFLEDLSRNNNRDWFHDNKKTYQEALGTFREFMGTILAGISKTDPSVGGLDAKDTIF